jgi:G3E family GTPase
VESTGLAYPGKILNTIGRHSKSIDNAVTITVVDSQRWEEYYAATPVLAKTQVTDGDIIIINKTDLVTEEQLTYVKNRVTELNPKAQIHKVSANQNVEDSVWEKVVGINE